MEITTSDSQGGIPPYPYFKVVIVAEQAEIAALPCNGTETENIVFHADLLSLLHESQPELAGHDFTAGWLTLSRPAALLYLAARKSVSQEQAERIGQAIGSWCETNGVSKLTIFDTSRRSDAETASSSSWDIEDWIPSA